MIPLCSLHCFSGCIGGLIGTVPLDVVVAFSIHNEVCVGSGVRVSLHVDGLVGQAEALPLLVFEGPLDLIVAARMKRSVNVSVILMNAR